MDKAVATLTSLFSLLIATWVAVQFGFDLAYYMGWDQHYFWFGTIGLFLLSFLTTNFIFSLGLGVLKLAGGGIWAASPVRWIVGKVAYLILAIPPAVVVFYGASWLGFGFIWYLSALLHPLQTFVPFVQPFNDDTGIFWLAESIYVPVLRLTVLTTIIGLIANGVRHEKPVVAFVTRPLRHLWRALKTGVGGSAAFDGLLDEWLMPWRQGQIILGTSLYEPGQRLGKTDDRHMLTIATTRSGKGRSCIIPNLLVWPGSALVIDPKGQNAAVTAPARRKMGQDIHILDPFEVLAGLGLDAADYPVQRFNPLSAIEIGAIDVVEQIGNLADALIMHSPHGNPFWDNASKAVLVGIIAHVLVWPELDDSERHLGTVRDYVSETNGRKLTDMAGHAGVANLTAIGASELKRSSAGAGGDIMTTLAVHVKWLDSLAMRRALAASDFDLATLKQRTATLYLIIPTDYLDEHARFLRLFITQAIRTAGRGVKARHPMLFVLDEFASLGALKVVEQAAGLLAGGGVKLWPIIQNLTQLRPYGDNWEVFLSNAGQVQVFAMNDQSTARYFSERLGHHISWRKVGTPGGYEWVPQGATWLRTAAELARESSRDSGRALVFYEGGAQALVRRSPYDKLFKSSEYRHDPYEAREPDTWFSRFQRAAHDRDFDAMSELGWDILIYLEERWLEWRRAGKPAPASTPDPSPAATRSGTGASPAAQPSPPADEFQNSMDQWAADFERQTDATDAPVRNGAMPPFGLDQELSPSDEAGPSDDRTR